MAAKTESILIELLSAVLLLLTFSSPAFAQYENFNGSFNGDLLQNSMVVWWTPTPVATNTPPFTHTSTSTPTATVTQTPTVTEKLR
jgi:hypothetical protein